MRRLALSLVLLLAGTPAFGSIVYSFTEQWSDVLGPDTYPNFQTYTLGFTYETPDFLTGSTVLTPDEVSACNGWPYDYETRCGGANVDEDSTGVTITRLMEELQWDTSGGPRTWGPPETSYGITAFFAGAQLDEFGTWTVGGLNVDGTGPTASATLTISDPPSVPEPASQILIALGLSGILIYRVRWRRGGTRVSG